MKSTWMLAALLAASPGVAASAPSQPLFTTILDASPNPPARTLSAYPVQVNFPALDANPASISVTLPGTGTFEATRVRFALMTSGGYHWWGKTTTHDVVLTVNGNLITGFIRGGGETYSVLTSVSGGASHSLHRMDAAAFPGDLTDPPAPEGLKGFDAKGATLAVPERKCLGTSAQPIDLLVVYSPQALAASGGDVVALENQVQNAVMGATVTLANSNVPVEVRLVHVEQAPASLIEQGDSDDYFNARGNVDLAVTRRFWSADVVTYLTSVGAGYCGVTRAMRRAGPAPLLGYGYDYAPFAYNVVTWQCGIQNNDISHEMGHNAGLDHNPESTANGTPTNNLYPYSFGHYVDGLFRDDMSSAQQCPNGCPREMFFSNPTQEFDVGVSRGTTDRDNAQTYQRMFRCVNTFAEVVFSDGYEQ